MMRKILKYEIEEELANAIKKIIGRINDVDFRETYKLGYKEMELVHKFYDLIEDEE